MPQSYAKERETAKRLYVESGGKILLKDLAKKLKAPPSTVSSWKKSDKWDEQLKRKPKKNQFNMKGNRRSAKPHPSQAGNKNPLKHGRYEELKYETLTEDEKGLMDEVRRSDDQIQMLKNLIAEFEVREKRMYARIEALRLSAEKDREGLITEYAVLETKGLAPKQEGEEPKSGAMRVSKQKKHGTDKIQDIENALTAVQKQHQAAIVSLHRLMEDKTSREIEKRKLDMEQKRLDLMERRLALIDPDADSDVLKEAREILGGIESAF